MKLALKLIAASLALAAAGQASATLENYLAPGTAGSSELFLAVWDQTTEKSYFRDLGIRMNDFMPALPTGTAADRTTASPYTNLSATGALAAPFSGAGVHNVGFTAGNGASLSGAAGGVALGSVLTRDYRLNFAAGSLRSTCLAGGGRLSANLKWIVGAVGGTGTVSTRSNRALTTSREDVANSGPNNGALGGFGTTLGYISANNVIGTNPVAEQRLLHRSEGRWQCLY